MNVNNKVKNRHTITQVHQRSSNHTEKKNTNEFGMLYKLNKEINIDLKSKFIRAHQLKKEHPGMNYPQDIILIRYNYYAAI